MTTEQFLALPDEFDSNGNQIKQELIAGEIVSVASASAVHDLIKNNIGDTLRDFLAAHPGLDCRALIEIAFAVAERESYQPDVCVIKKSRLLQLETRTLTRAPEIAIEVVSPSDFAAGLKHKILAYLAHGSGSVWVVYPDDRSIELHSSQTTREFTAGQVIQDPALPGFSHPVAGFFDGL